MLHIRDDAFAQLGDTNLADLKVQGSSPQFSVTKVEDLTPRADDAAHRAAGARGGCHLPCYLDQPGCPPGSQFAYAPGTDVPLAPAGQRPPGEVRLQHPALGRRGRRRAPARPSLYGHGLLGDASQVSGGAKRALANEHNS